MHRPEALTIAAARRLRYPDGAHAGDRGVHESRALQRMKKSAFFINIGRGMTTRLDDLVAALEAGEIAGAGLDVFEIEPLPAGTNCGACRMC